MYSSLIPEINESIIKTKRAIIGLGCSFVQGHGAIDQRIYDNYNWSYDLKVNPFIQWNLTPEESIQVINDFPDISLADGKTLNFSIHEMNNSFVNVLSKKYFNGKYTPINLGRSGCGNRAAIKELYYYPSILWNEIKEIIIVYCPSGAERFDFIDDTYHDVNEHGRWICSWPNSDTTDTPQNTFWKGYKDWMYSNKFEIMEQIAHVQELLTWVKLHNAKLIITPSFQQIYTRDIFKTRLLQNISRDDKRRLIKQSNNNEYEKIDKMLNMWPWDNMFYPEGNKTWMDMITKQEGDDTFFYNYLSTGSPKGWVTPCAHPSVKAHDLFASKLFSFIEKDLK